MGLWFKYVVLPGYRMGMRQSVEAHKRGDEFLSIAQSLRDKANGLADIEPSASEALLEEAQKYAVKAEKSFVEEAKINAENAHTRSLYPQIDSYLV